MADKRQFPHHLIREIFEQPEGLRRTIEPRVSLEQGLVRLDEIQIPREPKSCAPCGGSTSSLQEPAGMRGWQVSS